MRLFLLGFVGLFISCMQFEEPLPLCTTCLPIAIKLKLIDSVGNYIIPDSITIIEGDSVSAWNRLYDVPGSRVQNVMENKFAIAGSASVYTICITDSVYQTHTIPNIKVDVLPNYSHCAPNIPNTLLLEIMLKSNTFQIQDSTAVDCGC